MVRGKSLFASALVMLVACGSTPASTEAPSNHAAPMADCALTGVVFDSYNHEPARGASVILIGGGRPSEVQITDDEGRFTFAHAGGRLRLEAYYKDRPAKQAMKGCGEVRVQL